MTRSSKRRLYSRNLCAAVLSISLCISPALPGLVLSRQAQAEDLPETSIVDSNEYTIHFEKGTSSDGSEVSGEMEDLFANVEAGSSNKVVVPECAFEAEGSTFTSWHVSGSSNLVLHEGQELTELRFTDEEGNEQNLADYAEGGQVTLVAGWQEDLRQTALDGGIEDAYLMVSDPDPSEGDVEIAAETASVIRADAYEEVGEVEASLSESGLASAQDRVVKIDNGWGEQVYDPPTAAFEMLASAPQPSVHPDIVLIDTGTPFGADNVAGEISFVEGVTDTTDTNGHASSMLEIIRREAPDASVFYIKVIDDIGNVNYPHLRLWR